MDVGLDIGLDSGLDSGLDWLLWMLWMLWMLDRFINRHLPQLRSRVSTEWFHFHKMYTSRHLNLKVEHLLFEILNRMRILFI